VSRSAGARGGLKHRPSVPPHALTALHLDSYGCGEKTAGVLPSRARCATTTPPLSLLSMKQLHLMNCHLDDLFLRELEALRNFQPQSNDEFIAIERAFEALQGVHLKLLNASLALAAARTDL